MDKGLCADLETQRKNLIIKPDVFEAYMMSFDAHNRLVQIHPWVDGKWQDVTPLDEPDSI